MSTNISIYISLLSSSILCFFSNSWVILWILLEINTLSFCAINTNTSTSNANGEKESLINYLIIQSVASIILILSSLTTKSSQSNLILISIAIISSLIIKSAGAPLFQWFISVANNISWNNFIILATWQKLAPVYLLIFQNNSAILIPMIASIITGTVLMVNNTQINEILAYSSLFNLSWIIISIIISIKTLLLFIFIYWSIFISSVNPFNASNANEINSTNISSIPNETLFLIMTILAGIPPLLGFVINWIIILNILNLTMEYLITMTLVLSAVNLFVYFRLINFTNMTYSNSLNNSINENLFFLSTILILINILSFIIVTL